MRRTQLCAIAMFLLSVFSVGAEAQRRTNKKSFQVTWLGHAAFEIISSGGTHLLIDPWLKEDPQTPTAFKDLTRYHPAAILVTHSHFDLSQDAAEIAKASGAIVVSAYDWVETLGLPQNQKLGCNVGGGTVPIGDVTIHVVPAMHSSEPSGRPLRFILTFADGRSLYHTGDTWIFGDMALIEELYHPIVILQNVVATGDLIQRLPLWASRSISTLRRSCLRTSEPFQHWLKKQMCAPRSMEINACW